MIAGEGTLERADVDFFTATARLSQSLPVYEVARSIARDLDQSFTSKPWRFFGYEGFRYTVGDKGHFAYGESDHEVQGVIVQASGMFSGRVWHRFVTGSIRVSRIDLAVDAKPFDVNPYLCKEYFSLLEKSGNRQRKYSLIQNSMRGSTLYVGSRTSGMFGRVYDKGVEKGIAEPGELWRYELEVKGGQARECYKNMLSLASAKDNVDAAITTTVWDWFDQRNVPPVFKRSQIPPIGLKMEIETPSDERKIMWLKSQVAPTVRQLIMCGNPRVLEALGVTEFFNLKKKSMKAS